MNPAFPEPFEISDEHVPNFGVVIPGKLSRSAQPDTVGTHELKDAGVQVVFRLNEELEYTDFDESAVFEENLYETPLNAFFLDCKKANAIAADIEYLIEKGFWVHVHCQRGIDRTGLVIGLYRMRYLAERFEQIKKDWPIYGTPAINMQWCLESSEPKWDISIISK